MGITKFSNSGESVEIVG